MQPEYTIHEACEADVATLVDFTIREAREAEGVALDVGAVERGVRAAFASPPRAVYWIAESSEGAVAASISVVMEWSNFRGGDYWWIQSLFIVPEHRGTGLLGQLLEHLRGAAAAAGALELRLYAHTANERALRAYRRLGFVEAPYVIMRRSPGAE
jgi:GNAT superfamily N-acetyltransferase